jgi:hypothetical protein
MGAQRWWRRLVGAGGVGIALAGVLGGIPASAAPAAASVTVAPYVDMGEFPTPVLSSMASSGHLRSVTMAFVTAAGCKASWFNAFDPTTGWQLPEVKKIRAAGGDVKISFGGASGIDLAQACTSASALAAQYDAVIKAYALKYIDMDIEGAAVADPTSVNRRSQALAMAQHSNSGLKVSLTLPVLPSGLTSDGVAVLTSAKKAGVSVNLVNIMAMDYGSANGDMGKAAIAAARATEAQVKSVFGVSDATAWKMIGVTPMLGRNDTSGETFSQANAKALVAFAKQMHIGMLSFWELGRDANACNGALFKCTNVPQKPFDFAKIFAGFTG